MTNKPEMVSVPRELLERLAYGEWECASLKDRDTLRTLLAAPAEDVRAVGEEPVGYASEYQLNRMAKGHTLELTMCAKPTQLINGVALYRHPQRPVVLPEERTRRTSDDRDEAYDNGFNDCLNAVEELNK